MTQFISQWETNIISFPIYIINHNFSVSGIKQVLGMEANITIFTLWRCWQEEWPESEANVEHSETLFQGGKKSTHTPPHRTHTQNKKPQ